MKKILIVAALMVTPAIALAGEVCQVTVCNKIERFSLDIFSHIKDSMGEQCYNIVIPKEDAVVDSVLAEDSRWYQGSSINPTKKSVTRVKAVIECGEMKLQ